ncbi:MAG: hypothetical protein HOV94_08145 [Saccharothrix sp.]|nr:hypothetical protein [Saccharothrix sp.]
MVQLRDADWAAWERAAKGWRTFADQAAYAGKDIRRQGKDKLDEHWQDEVGEAAGKVLGGLAAQYDCASDLMRSVAMILEGLAQAVDVAQRQLVGAVDMARAHHLRVDDDGTAAPYDHPDSQGDNGYTDAMEHKPVVERMVRDAVEAATQADDLASKQLAKLKDSTSITDVGKALDEFQAVASKPRSPCSISPFHTARTRRPSPLGGTPCRKRNAANSNSPCPSNSPTSTACRRT